MARYYDAYIRKEIAFIISVFIVGLVWICWHIPLWFIKGDPHQSISFISFAILGIMLSYWLSAVYNFTGAVVFCMIMHGWTNTMMGLLNIKKSWMYYLMLILFTVISIVFSILIKKRHKLNE